MKKFIITFVCFITVTSCLAQVQKQDCDKFRKGDFIYVNDSASTIYITRKKKLQEEFEPKTGIKNLFKIWWIADCEYKIRQIGSNSKKQRKYNNTETVIKIVNISGDRYDYICACKDSTYSKTGTVVMMK